MKKEFCLSLLLLLGLNACSDINTKSPTTDAGFTEIASFPNPQITKTSQVTKTLSNVQKKSKPDLGVWVNSDNLLLRQTLEQAVCNHLKPFSKCFSLSSRFPPYFSLTHQQIFSSLKKSNVDFLLVIKITQDWRNENKIHALKHQEWNGAKRSKKLQKMLSEGNEFRGLSETSQKKSHQLDSISLDPLSNQRSGKMLLLNLKNTQIMWGGAFETMAHGQKNIGNETMANMEAKKIARVLQNQF